MSEAERLALAAVKIGQQMRAAQTAYFKTRQDHAEKRDRLNAAQRLERDFDKAAAAAVAASEGLAL
jgi:hypothetical protein